MLINLAPIGVSTYVRLQHLQRTIAALQGNILAQQSELFVFSDGPRPEDTERVVAVRNYLRTVNGFKKVHIVKRRKNNRVANNRGGINMLLNRFGKMIFLEEDVVTAPGFLTFMNQALNKYEGDDRVFSVAGYCPPIKIPTNYRHDVFFLRRLTAWGFGIWKDRFDQLRYITPNEYERFAANKKQVKNFVKSTGNDLMSMLRADAYGEIDAGDVKLMYAQFLSDQYTLYSTKSLVQYIGNDGTGTHCGKTDKFDVVLSPKTTFQFPSRPFVDRRIVKANRIFRDRDVKVNLRAQVVGKARRVIYKLLFSCLPGLELQEKKSGTSCNPTKKSN